jgi:flavin-dependent dehydrogenase
MQSAIRKVVIIGGGTAGWLTAGLLAARHRADSNRALEIVLIESPDIPTIGVGEGTWPSMRMTLQKIGISEADLVRNCDASFKQGTEFVDWSSTGGDSRYYHPFSFPAEYSSLKLANYWLEAADRFSFADFVTPQASVIEAGLAPKQVSTPEYAFNVNYGYHFDAGRFAELLHKHVVDKLGVTYVSANVGSVESHDSGDIDAVVLTSGERVQGDLFVDCTGQRSLLIGQHYGIDVVSMKKFLFNDAAIAVQVPYSKPDDPIASATRATAVECGWIWDIGLQTRRGIGHVYSTAHADEAQAMASIRDYVTRTSPGVQLDDLTFRSIPFEPGYRREFWVNNCVAVGLSGGFIEPLEASALALIEQAASIISEQFPANRELMSVVARRFNARMLYHWERVIEFLKLHYVLSKRDDSDYWRDCRSLETCPSELRDKLMLWQQQPPWHDDAPRVDELFPSASYQYVLYGMQFRPEYVYIQGDSDAEERARVDRLLHTNSDKTRQMLSLLPTNRELVSAMTALRGVA